MGVTFIKVTHAMTENLVKYLPLALRIGAASDSKSQGIEGDANHQNQAIVTDKNPFVVDAKFSLGLDEII